MKPMRMLLLLLAVLALPARAEIYDIRELRLEDYRGKVVYLDFWASWCKPCRQSFPWMNSLLARYPADRFTVITINLDAETDAMHRFLKQISADFDVFHDPSGDIATSFALEGMPTALLIDPDGKVVKRHIGFYEKKVDQYESEIEALL